MLLENGIWISTDTPKTKGKKPALFLDRDGVVVKEAHYLSRAEDVVLEYGAVELLRWARENGHAIIVVTNQSGIARGLFDWTEFETVDREINRQLKAQGIGIDLTLACAFHKDHTPGYGEAQARWRKPGPAMLELGAAMTKSDIATSWMVGDRVSDIGAARNAGLTGAVHVATGHGAEASAAALAMATDAFSVLTARDPMEAHQLLRGVWPSSSS
jgi:D-glycero-D-manno-heptose 1,7-bisphosphate phosphatase